MENMDLKKVAKSCERAVESCDKAQKKAILAIKISLCAVLVSAILGILALWTLLNQATISVGIDKKLIEMEARLSKIDKGDKRAGQGDKSK